LESESELEAGLLSLLAGVEPPVFAAGALS
jgi:hypothetical protein